VRFTPQGTFDARDGGVYRADETYTYSPGATYRFRFDVDVRTRTYSVWWKHTTFNDNYHPIGRNYAFRTEQAGVTRLTNIASFVNPDTGAHGSVSICNTSVVRDATTADGCTINTAGAGFSNKAVGASSQVMIVDVNARAGAANIDGVFGVTTGPADDYNDMATAIRFFTNGRIEARDASTYRADRIVTYQPGDTFTLRFVIDLWSRTYSVFVAGPGLEEGVELARGYRFRPQATGTTLDHVTSIVASPTGRFDTCMATGRDAAPAVHARPGHFNMWPLNGENVFLSNASATMWIDAVGRVLRTLPRGGEIAADDFANFYLSNTSPAGVLTVEALTPTFTTRWTQSYAIPINGTILDAMMFDDGTLGLHIAYENSGATIERIGADGTYVGRLDVSGVGVSLDRRGYAMLSNDGGGSGATIERHTVDGSLVWSRVYSGPYTPSDLASASDGSIVFTGFNTADYTFGSHVIHYSSHPDADNSFVASLSPTGEPRYAQRLDASWIGGLATNGTRLVVARQKHIGPIINEYVMLEVNGAWGQTYESGLSSFGDTWDVEIGTTGRIYANAGMAWPENFSRWAFTVGIGP